MEEREQETDLKKQGEAEKEIKGRRDFCSVSSCPASGRIIKCARVQSDSSLVDIPLWFQDTECCFLQLEDVGAGTGGPKKVERWDADKMSLHLTVTNA